MEEPTTKLAMDPLPDKPLLQPESTIEELKNAEFKKNRALFFFLFFTIGLMNNNTGVVINTGAQDLASKFGFKNLMASFQICLTVFGGVVRVLNSRYLLKFKHQNKIIWVVIAWSTGFTIFFFSYMLIGKNDTIGFIMSLTATVIIGSFASVGDATIIGFMKAIPAENIAGWSSGTGIAGLTGAGLYLIFSTIGMEFNHIVIALFPISFIYFANFKVILNLKAAVDKKFPDQTSLVDPNSNKDIQSINEEKEAKVNESLSWPAIKNVLKLVGFPIYNLSWVYFLEYCCTTSFAERANPKKTDTTGQDFWHRKAFVLLALSYQLGVFISRSSFYLFKVRRVDLLTYSQAINFFVFFSIAYWKWIEIYYQIPIMIWVGLMGGCSYVNCYFMILENKALSKSQKEIAINVAAFFNDIGIVSAAFFAIFVSNFVIVDS